MTRHYRCKNLIKQHHFNGFDSGIIRQLPFRIRSDFPALLTHKSGISKDLVELMRPLFQNSVGPVRLSKILRIMHAEHYAGLELQYHDAACNMEKNPGIDSILTRGNTEKIVFPEFSEFSDKGLYNGYVPSPSYLRYIYTSITEKIRPQLNWHMTSLNALYTCLNEYEEIRMQVWAPSKALSHPALPFNALVKSYNLNGYQLPSLFYTDNVSSDRAFLEGVLPNLLDNVRKTSIQKPANSEETSTPEHNSDLPVLTLPDTANISVFSVPEDIDNACQNILNGLETSNCLYVGFDCKWIARNRGQLVLLGYRFR
ncbi:hypothetical protein INT47_009288 [Mucor saturninus]|uniref:DUF6729 domain-containing protein n=1 Tax=Mucor saturninus TaxID=64648 RepID=A0A8H7QIE8_9FUNG|nr:hypothetical protein INT47_009288 [Mucor saturninus]